MGRIRKVGNPPPSPTPRRIMPARRHRPPARRMGMVGIAVPVDLLEVEPPVAQVAHCALRPRPPPVGQVHLDRHGVVEGESVSGRLALGGRRPINKNTMKSALVMS